MATVGSSVLPAAKAVAAIPAGVASVLLLQGVLLPAGVKPAPKPPAPPPPVKSSPPRPKRGGGGGGSIGGGNPSENYYRGCFADGQFGARTLPTVLISGGSNLTRLTCAQAASAADLPYFGLQGGNTCYGGSNLAMAQSQGVSASCTARCTGDANQICGGANATTLWSFAKASVPTPTCDEESCYLSLGCFVEPFCKGGTRGMARLLTPKEICFPLPFGKKYCLPAVSAASVPLCAKLAKAYNYRFFSLQNGGDCYGSNGTAYAMSRGLSNACTTVCRSAAGTTCGGNCANAIYKVGERCGWVAQMVWATAGDVPVSLTSPYWRTESGTRLRSPFTALPWPIPPLGANTSSVPQCSQMVTLPVTPPPLPSPSLPLPTGGLSRPAHAPAARVAGACARHLLILSVMPG